MNKTTRAGLSLLVATALTLGTSTALADEPAKTGAAASQKRKPAKKAKAAAEPNRDYEYKFDDDPMQAGNHGAYTAQIRVVKMGSRDRLIRPRTQFVTELIRSIEQL